jgi:pentatricopeptide repeat protein
LVHDGCAAGQWKAAQEVYEQMLPCGCKPDSMTYGILISAYDKGNQWCLALQVYFSSPLLLI